MDRLYLNIVKWHMQHDEQMIFLSGPRQVGKTTISQALETMTDHFVYFNWDRLSHRQAIMQGVDEIAKFAHLSEPSEHKPIIVFDEIHKYSKWKNLLKGFYDTYKHELHTIVTGSAKLDVYKKGSDSLMGRYFPYRVHPFSVAECLRNTVTDNLIQQPQKIDDELYSNLLRFGGFPEPFLKQNDRYHKRWQTTRMERLFEEEIRTLSQIQEIDQMEILAKLIKSQVGDILNRSTFARQINVSVSTINRWLATLERFFYIFMIRPWSKNVTRSLTKEPKVYLWDWSEHKDPGKLAENFIASHLLKAIHYWKDTGLGDFDLYFIRDKDKNEVDFLVTKDEKPWIMVEVKNSDNQGLSSALYRFKEELNVPHAFQVALNKPYVNVDCFSYDKPIIVSAMTFLSQLV